MREEGADQIIIFKEQGVYFIILWGEYLVGVCLLPKKYSCTNQTKPRTANISHSTASIHVTYNTNSAIILQRTMHLFHAPSNFPSVV